MAKAPALSTQLKAANEKITALEKQLADVTKTKDLYYGYYQDAKNVVEEVHTLLDTLSNTVKRRGEGMYADYSPMVRLASYFANNKGV